MISRITKLAVLDALNEKAAALKKRGKPFTPEEAAKAVYQVIRWVDEEDQKARATLRQLTEKDIGKIEKLLSKLDDKIRARIY